MGHRTRYRLKQHHKFEQDGRRYVADLETGDIVQVNAVEWSILSRYESQTRYHMVERLRREYKLTAIFDGIERLEHLGRQGCLLRPVAPDGQRNDAEVSDASASFRDASVREGFQTAKTHDPDRKPKVLVPFHFTKEKSTLDYHTNLNRYRSLAHLAAFAELETLAFPEEAQDDIQDFDKIRVRNVGSTRGSALMAPWYAMEGYDGILLLSQFLTDDLLYYRIPDVPIVHCIEGAQRLQHALVRTLLTLRAFQSPKDTLLAKSSWMQDWLVSELGMPAENVCVIPDGIDRVTPIGEKVLAKQHTAALFDTPIFVEKPMVGLIAGFEPNPGAAWISEFARANPHLAIFVYDATLEQHYRYPPENVVIFGADDAETRSVLPIFFQALDLVCFPAMPGTPLSVVLEAMAFGAPCVAMTKYGMPAELTDAGVDVKADWDLFGNFQVSMAEVSAAVNAGLQPSATRTQYENAAGSVAQQYTGQNAARELLNVFAEGSQRNADTLRAESPPFPPLFCRRYEPDTGTVRSCVYRFGTNRYEGIEPAVAAVLTEQHTPAEVESVFKHFQRETPDTV